MKRSSAMILLVSMAILMTSAMAQNPLDNVSGALQQHINQAQGQVQQKVAEHISEGNLTSKHIQEEVNATGEELKRTAAQEIKEHANISAQDISQKAKEELTNQVNQKVQQPGFEAAFAAAGFLIVAYLSRRRD
jgi:hypothetical protein